MNRRDIMKLFGLGTIAAATPVMIAAPVAAPSRPITQPTHPVFQHFTDPMFAYIHMRGGLVYRERIRGMRFSLDRDTTTLRLDFDVWHTGEIAKVAVVREGVELCSLDSSTLNTTFVVKGSSITINLTAQRA